MPTRAPLKRPTDWLRTATARYALYGALFGCCFPLVATLLDLALQHRQVAVASILWAQQRQPLHWIIDTAPFFLGLFASLAGRRQDLLSQLNAQLEQKVSDRVTALSKANQELENEVAERKRAEAALQESEQRSRTISDLVSDYAYAARIEPDGTYLLEWVTEAFRHITGFTLEKGVYQAESWVNFIYPDDMPIIIQRLRGLMSGQTDVSEFRIVAESGEVRWVREYGRPVWDEAQGRVVRLYIAGHDITDRKQAEEASRESEGRWRTLFNHVPTGVYRMTPDGRILDANPALIKMLGYASFEELAARDCAEESRRPEYARPEFRERIERDGEIRGLEIPWRKRDDSEIFVRENAKVIQDAEGAVLYYEGTVEDITERKRAEAELRVSEARKEAILELALDCIITIDHQGNVLEFNPAAEKTFGYTRAEVLGKAMADLIVPPAWREKHRRGLVHYLATGEGPVLGKWFEITALRADGSEFPIELAIIPIHLGEQPVFTAYLRDITSRKEVERLKDELGSTVSHELRTPLTSLRGFTELMLKREFTPEKQREFLRIIHSESIRLTNLINNFLDLRRIESGRQAYHLEPIEIGPLLRECVVMFAQEERKHTLRLAAPDDLPLIQANPDCIRQLLANLLSNAIKFSPGGGEVTVGARATEAGLVVWVADQGIGIPPEAMPKLFGRFFRVNSKEVRTTEGTGLGLALVKELVETQGGKVWAESELGKGSTFFFTLPTVAHPAQVQAAPRLVAAAETTDILLVEDDQAYARLLQEHFANAGLTVAVTDRAEEALALVRHSAPRLVLTDIRLAGQLDGWDLLVALKGEEGSRSIPVLIISTSEEANVRGLALAGADYLLKPVPSDWLLHATRQRLPVLSRKHVLVVDDDTGFCRQVEGWLTSQGVTVEEAADGREALEHIGRSVPDLILLDLLMPQVDGFEVLRRLRTDKRAMNLPVLVVTSKDLLPNEKAYLKQKLATLVSKREASLDYFARVVRQMLQA
jgi:PAS domain S-box-containing protein